jgi:integrase
MGRDAPKAVVSSAGSVILSGHSALMANPLYLVDATELTILLHPKEANVVAFGSGEGWQVHDAAGRRKYLSRDERVRFLRVADGLAPRMRALCYVLAYAGCRVSEALALTGHHIDAERLTLTIKTLKRRRIVFRAVPVPETTIAMLRALPREESGRLWPVHRVTAWRAVKATMLRARHHRADRLPQRAAARFRDTRRGPQRPDEPDSALDGPRLAHDDRYLPRCCRARGTPIRQSHVVM